MFFKRILSLILLLIFGASVEAQPVPVKPAINFPMVAEASTPKAEPTKLSGEMLYVIHGDTPFFVIEEPEGLVTITEKSGPLTLGGRFIDGTGKLEFRDYKSKQIWIIQAAGKGKVALLVVPQGATKKSDVIRKVLDVDGDEVIQPPPKDKIAAHVTFVGAEKTAFSLATNNDVALRSWLAAKKIKVHVLKADSPEIATTGMSDAVKLAGGAPAVVLQDAAGNVIAQARMTSTADVMLFVSPYTGK